MTPRPKRLPPNSIKLQFAGELVLSKCPNKDLMGLCRRYEAIFEALANQDRDERLLNYIFFAALALTSHAKKAQDLSQKRSLFDLKNQLFLKVANTKDLRRKLGFKYLESQLFRVNYCEACTESNKENANRSEWTFCKECKVDRNFFNVLSMHHKFPQGQATIFLSNDMIPKVQNLKIKNKDKLSRYKEEATFQKYHFGVKNLDAIELNSILTWHQKLMAAEI